MKTRNIIAIATTGAVLIFFMILIAYAAYGIVICFTEQSTIVNFKNFAISNAVLIGMGSMFFFIGLIALYMVYRKMHVESEKTKNDALSQNSSTQI